MRLNINSAGGYKPSKKPSSYSIGDIFIKYNLYCQEKNGVP